MKLFPAIYALPGKSVVIAGGGELARRKARLLVAEGVDVRIIAPAIEGETRAEFTGSVTFVERGPRTGDFTDAALAIIAEEDEARAEAWGAMASTAGAPVNVVDQPTLSDFQTPSIVDRGEVVVAIATGGGAPVLARRLREQIDRLLPARLGALVSLARDFRPLVAERLPAAARRGFWERFFKSAAAAQCLAGDDDAARREILRTINHGNATGPGLATGVVHIVGAGPGDPELLTIRAQRLLQEADVIVYDRLVTDDILGLARRDAQRIYVGKAKSDHAVPQGDIEKILIDHARAGAMVVRLKGGDPFIFGRGGEELETLRAAGVEAFVTPGVTAALGCAASAGIALTHRDHAQAVTFVTGHAKGDREPDLDWRALAGGGTLVFYMGVSKAETIAGRLIEAGAAATTPVAIIENGTRADQTIVTGTLADLGALAQSVTGPAILVIGSVAALAATQSIRTLTEITQRAAA